MAVMLGDVLAAARRSAGSLRSWLGEADPALAAELDAAAAEEAVEPGDYTRLAVADFTREADEEAWAELTRRLRNDPEDPGAECLRTMLRWRLAQERRRHDHRSPG